MKLKAHLFILLTFVFVLLTGCSSTSSSADQQNSNKEELTVNIGIQQSLGPLLLAKEKGWFEEEFAKVGVDIKWTVFQSGPPHFEAMTANRLDFGAVGNSPVISAQGAGIPFTEIALTKDGLKENAILVKNDSPIKTLEDLKGKKIGVAKGSSGFDFLNKALTQAGLAPEDIELIQLQPDEALPAFESGAIDAWSIWEPFISLQFLNHDARILADGESLKLYSPGFIIARTEFIKEHPDLAVLFLKVYEKARLYQNENREETIDIYAESRKIDKEVVRRVLENNEALNLPITDEIIKDQQETADFQHELEIIPKKIDTSDVVDNTYIEKALKEMEEES
ncbi:aliphatic sulfonate ABC transporter substrate-binding protein [Niallia sp. Krafla_26]|uniref:aliphatic sulfonate ABC transporter substrate-binding protein n=1 Tax=Niallia sp. Krafla_26 TaxID=3064703 RepID=UPI003D1832FD